eukprot:31198-Pelagococcus_subviridis.AAC.60
MTHSASFTSRSNPFRSQLKIRITPGTAETVTVRIVAVGCDSLSQDANAIAHAGESKSSSSSSREGGSGGVVSRPNNTPDLPFFFAAFEDSPSAFRTTRSRRFDGAEARRDATTARRRDGVILDTPRALANARAGAAITWGVVLPARRRCVERRVKYLRLTRFFDRRGVEASPG